MRVGRGAALLTVAAIDGGGVLATGRGFEDRVKKRFILIDSVTFFLL